MFWLLQTQSVNKTAWTHMKLGMSGWSLLGQVGMLALRKITLQGLLKSSLLSVSTRPPGAPGQEEKMFPQPNKRPLSGRKWKGYCAPMSSSLDKTEGLLSYKVIKDQPPGFLCSTTQLTNMSFYCLSFQY